MKKIRPFPVKASGWALAALLVITVSLAYAAPMPPRTVINHKTQQCAQITPGDECGDVLLPPDWEYLDTAAGEKCPDNYTFVELQLKWTPFKSQFCCSIGHSGSAGDCKDVIIQQDKRECAFVADIQKCNNLPEGWTALGKNCPVDFYWTSEIVCASSESNPTKAVTDGGQTEPTASIQPSETPPADQTRPAGSSDTHNPLFPCFSAGLALIVLIGASLWRR